MKKIITFLFVMLSCWTYAQNIRHNHFTADVDYNWSVGDFNNEYGYRGLDFWGIAATGGYRFYMIDGLYISPQVSLYYENHKLDRIYRDIPWGIDATRSVSINPDEGEEISNKIMTVFFSLLILLLVFVLFNDIYVLVKPLFVK